MFLVLYVTFRKINARDIRPRLWHLWLEGARLALSLLLVWLAVSAGSESTDIVLDGGRDGGDNEEAWRQHKLQSRCSPS